MQGWLTYQDGYRDGTALSLQAVARGAASLARAAEGYLNGLVGRDTQRILKNHS